jgi:ATP-dependent Lon protease
MSLAITDGVYPVLPLRDIVLFPHVVAPLFVGRDKSIAALDNAIAFNKPVLLVAQTDSMMDTPHSGDLYSFGTLANILQMIKLPDGTVKILVEGKYRAKIKDWTQNETFFEAYAEVQEDNSVRENEIEPLTRSIRDSFEDYVQLQKQINPEIMTAIDKIQKPDELADIIATHLNVKLEEKQKLLEQVSLSGRLEMLFKLIEKEIDVLQVEQKIRKRVKKQMEKSQREYYLNEQMKAIQHELGDEEGGETNELEKKIKDAGMSVEATEKAMSELKKLRMMGPMSAEAGVIRNYLDWLIALPWRKKR